MPTESAAWSKELDREAAILRAIAIALALKQKLPPEDLACVPSLAQFIALAQTVAEEIGWGDQSS